MRLYVLSETFLQNDVNISELNIMIKYKTNNKINMDLTENGDQCSNSFYLNLQFVNTTCFQNSNARSLPVT